MAKRIEITNIPEDLFNKLFTQTQKAIFQSGVSDFEMICLENEKDEHIGYEFECK